MKSQVYRLLVVLAAAITILGIANGAAFSQTANEIEVLDWSPDGKLLAVGYDDGTVEIVDAETNQTVKSFEIPNRTVNDIAWHPTDPNVLAVASGYGTIEIINITTPTGRAFPDPVEDIDSITWSPDGTQLAGAVRLTLFPDAAEFVVLIWDVATGNVLSKLKGHTNVLSAIAWSPDGSRIISGSADSTAIIWDAATGAPLITLEPFDGLVTAVTWSPDSQYVATASVDSDLWRGEIQIWDSSSGALLATYMAEDIHDVAWSPIGSQLAIADGNTLQILDLVSEKFVETFQQMGIINSLDWSPDGSQIDYGGEDGAVFIARQERTILAGMVSVGAAETPTAESDGGERVLFTSDRDGEIALYTMLSDGSDVEKLQVELEPEAEIVEASMSSDGGKLAWISRKDRDGDGFTSDEIFVADLDRNFTVQLTNDACDKGSLVWMPDGQRLLYLVGGPYGEYEAINVLDVATRTTETLIQNTAIDGQLVGGDYIQVAIRGIDISPDGQQLVLYLRVDTSIEGSEGPEIDFALATINLDGTDLRRITSDDSTHPSWGGDINQLYFVCKTDEYDEICRIDLQTSEIQMLTDLQIVLPPDENQYIGQLSVSSSDQVVFQMYRSSVIYRLDVDNGTITNLTEGSTAANRLMGWGVKFVGENTTP